jgi:hypothetical protein
MFPGSICNIEDLSFSFWTKYNIGQFGTAIKLFLKNLNVLFLLKINFLNVFILLYVMM